MFLTDLGVATALKKSFPIKVFLPPQDDHLILAIVWSAENLQAWGLIIIYRNKFWNDLIKDLPYQGCFLIWSIRKEMFNSNMPLQIWGSMIAAWRPTTPEEQQFELSECMVM